MRIAIGSDERCSLTDAVVAYLKRQDHKLELFGPLADEPLTWPDVAAKVAKRVSLGACDSGVLFCWTGTGVSIAANKVPGVRAALCTDAETARGARKWNDANVLCMGLRLTSETVAVEVLEAWLSTQSDPSEAENVQKVRQMDMELGARH